jgi:hypothetical protein
VAGSDFSITILLKSHDEITGELPHPVVRQRMGDSIEDWLNVLPEYAQGQLQPRLQGEPSLLLALGHADHLNFSKEPWTPGQARNDEIATRADCIFNTLSGGRDRVGARKRILTIQ